MQLGLACRHGTKGNAPQRGCGACSSRGAVLGLLSHCGAGNLFTS